MALFDLKKAAIKPKDQEIADDILRKRDRILVCCAVFYRFLGCRLIEDKEFDKLCQDLVILQNKYPEVARKVAWAKFFKDYKGKNNYDLPHNYPKIVEKAEKWFRANEYKKV